ncbi:hypothetical protein B4N84_10275 [Flavobacterium sp. IR1]|nr:hypothetical protein B4N84_10275 [Flavobacterium sp. IR1]
MNTKLLACLFLLFSIHSYSQITFQKGYFIDNNNKKTDCLIKNLDWLNNPTDLEYKLDEQDQSIKINISQLKSFGIDNESKYEKHTVDIDRSSRILSEMGYDKNPIFKSEDLLLKVLIEGKATLLEYNNDNLTRYFFKTDSLPVTQLIHKSYKITEAQVAENNQYKQQLWMGLKCDNIAINEVENLSYKKNRLIKFFIKYNQCNNSEFVDYKVKEKKDRDFFNLTIRPGITSSNLSVSKDEVSFYNIDFDNNIAFRIGLEAEFILPFNKNKWAVIFEPTYQTNKFEKVKENYRGDEMKQIVEYNTIEFPFGFRHYMFLNNNSKIFINAQYIIEHSINSRAYFERFKNISNELDLTPKSSFAFGLGYNFKKKYSIEARANLRKNILGNYLEWTSTYQSFALVFGYSIF